MDTLTQTLALTLGASWASGINLSLALFFLLLIWVLPMLWHGIKRVIKGLRKHFGGAGAAAGEPPRALGAAPPGSPIDGVPLRLDAKLPRV